PRLSPRRHGPRCRCLVHTMAPRSQPWAAPTLAATRCGVAAVMAAPLRILHADAHIAVVDKPAGLIAHESRLAGAETDTLVARVRAQLGQPAWLAHRLDRATSGCVLFGLDRALMATLGAGFMERQVEKRYLA